MNYLKRCVAKFVSLNKTQDTTCSLHEEMLMTISSILEPVLRYKVFYQNERRIQVPQKKLNIQ